MSATNVPAPPIPELVIRKLDSQTTIFSVPFSRMGVIPFGGRSTAIALKDGSVFVAASTPLDPATLETINGLGEVKHLALLDAEHTMYATQYREAFPAAKLYLPAGAVSKAKDKGYLPASESQYFVFGEAATTGESGALTSADPLAAATGGEMESADFGKAFANEDIAFYHAPTKTVIEADLLFNLPPTEQYSRTNAKATLPFLSSSLAPGTKAHQRFLWYALSKDRAEMSVMAKKVAAWDFERIIPAHGDVIETGGKKAWVDTYRHFLEQ